VRQLFTIALFALILVSCTKDEVVAPGVPTQKAAVSVDELSKGADDDDTTDPDTSGGGISDDGDDLNDGEGRRKKKKP
jgi:hypothetical protein